MSSHFLHNGTPSPHSITILELEGEGKERAELDRMSFKVTEVEFESQETTPNNLVANNLL